MSAAGPDRRRYERVKRLYLEARAVPAAEREAWLDAACGDDPLLAAEVRSLLAAETLPERPRGAPAAAPEAGAVPARVGPYEIEELLGVGAMGVVYRARDTRLGRPVALKFLAEALAADPAARERFGREARAASALDHPHLCTLYDVGEHRGRIYLAMAYYPGGNLRRRLRHGPLPVAEAVKVAAGAARGLAALHRRGIVHRDVKPANLAFGESGEVKLLDFGIAKLADLAGLTHSGAALGTPGYMAPEQVRGEEAGPATDVWGLGALLYEMLAGEPPFPGEGPAALYATLHEQHTPLAERRPEVGERLAGVVERCLAKEPDRRYADAGELLTALENAAAGEGATAAAPYVGARPRRRARGIPSARRVTRLAVWLAAPLLAAVALLLLPGMPPAPAGDGAVVGSLAVLPFDHPSGDPQLTELAGGLAERITHNLSQLDGVTVIASSSSARLAGRGLAPAEIATRLGVEGLVTGRLERQGEAISVGAELVEPASGRQIWGGDFDPGPQELIGLERSLSREIARALKRRLSPAERSGVENVGTRDPAAYREHLVGLHLERQGRHAEAVAAHRRAVELDPGFAVAWAAEARDYDYLGLFGQLAPETAYRQARAAAERALKLDRGLADAWTTLGHVEFFSGGDLDRALSHARRGVELDPGSALAHYTLGALAIAADDAALARRELGRSLTLDPLAPAVRMQLARVALRQHRWQEAARLARENRDFNPAMTLSALQLAHAELRMGDAAAARAALVGLSSLRAELLRALADGRRSDAAEALAERADAWRRGPRGGDDEAGEALDLLQGSALLGDGEAALGWMQTLAGLPNGKLMLYQVLPSPELDPLRADRRFRQVLRTIGAPASFGRAAVADRAG